MNNMHKITIPFRVSSEKHLPPNGVFAVTGDIPLFGIWHPQKVLTLDRINKTVDGELWGKDITVPVSESGINFRYLIAEVTEFNDEDDSKFVKILQWETFREPRSINIRDVLFKEEITVDVFGTYNGQTNIERGWLTGQREIHLRVYGEAFKWFKPRHGGRRLYLRCSHVWLRHESTVEVAELPEESDPRGAWAEDEMETTDSGPLPHLQRDVSYSVLRKGLTVARPVDPQCNRGAVEITPGDYLTFQFQTLDLEAMSVEFEVFVGSRFKNGQTNNVMDSEPRMIGTVRMMPFEHLSGIRWMHIFGNHRRVIGQMRVDFLVITPLDETVQLLDVSYAKYWRCHGILKVGHRGAGTSYSEKDTDMKMSAVKENTLRSLRTAFEHGADYVEFDVHLSKDKVPVVYHDFQVVLTLKKKRRQDHRYMEVAVKDLTLEELQGLKVSHSGVLHAGHSNKEMVMEESDEVETLAFCSLRQIFEYFGGDDTTAGFNIEVKHPMMFKNGDSEQENYFERNEAVNIILKEVFRFAGKRRIIFSTFDPDVCTMLRLKQNKYPVLFLTQGATTKYMAYGDLRTRSTEMSMLHALDIDILGVCAFADEILSNDQLMPMARQNNLVVFVWGADIENAETHQKLKDMPVDGIIFDRIHEYHQHGTVNVFRAGVSNDYGSSSLPSIGGVALEESCDTDNSISVVSVSSDTITDPKGCSMNASGMEEPTSKRLRDDV